MRHPLYRIKKEFQTIGSEKEIVSGKKRANSIRKYGIPEHIKYNPFYLYAWRKINHYQENLIVGISGPTGSGKTTLAIKIAHDLDLDNTHNPRFPSSVIEKDGRVNYLPRLVNSISDYKRLRRKNWPYGTCFIIDESQVLLNSRRFMSNINLDIIKMFSTGRIFRDIVLLTLPYWEHIDRQLKNYLHIVIKTTRPDRTNKISNWCPYHIVPMSYGQEPILRKFRYTPPYNSIRHRKLDNIRTHLPPKDYLYAMDKKTIVWKKAVQFGMIDKDGRIMSEEEIIERSLKKRVKGRSVTKFSSETKQ